ncbi:hypothetical protein CHUAL_000040 [Chamberlinius hualienensis]
MVHSCLVYGLPIWGSGFTCSVDDLSNQLSKIHQLLRISGATSLLLGFTELFVLSTCCLVYRYWKLRMTDGSLPFLRFKAGSDLLLKTRSSRLRASVSCIASMGFLAWNYSTTLGLDFSSLATYKSTLKHILCVDNEGILDFIFSETLKLLH